MNAPKVLASLLAMPVAACATAMDTKREGEPVIAATVEQIKGDPSAWDGKWVRLVGWIDEKNSMLSVTAEGYPFIDLNPEKHLKRVGSSTGEPEHRAIVSGRVDLTCWSFWQETRAYHEASFETDHPILEVWAAGSLQYCNRSIGPYLTRILVSPVLENTP